MNGVLRCERMKGEREERRGVVREWVLEYIKSICARDSASQDRRSQAHCPYNIRHLKNILNMHATSMHAENVALMGISNTVDYPGTLLVTSAQQALLIHDIISYSYSYGFQRSPRHSMLEMTK